MALLLHDRWDLVRNHILNHLFQIERFGMVLTGNRTFYLTRSQTPLLADSIRQYCQDQIDVELVMFSYPWLVKEYREYWNASHHQTPTGLATHRDLGDPRLRPELAAEAESLDFTPCYGGDIRTCVPLQLNCALVRYADNLAWMADVLRLPEEAEVWTRLATRRRELIRELCWDDKAGFFFEYQFVRGERLPFWSLGAYWTLWAGVATRTQAAQLASHLPRFLHRGGLAQTDVAYPSPHPEFSWLQWGYPSAWPPSQMIVVEGLDRYGFQAEAHDVAVRYLDCMLTEYDRTGKFWEKYNAVEATSSLPRERTPCVPLHGWTTASAVWLGHRLYNRTVPSFVEEGEE
jgi:alpha,alpha-trehalase